MARSDGVAFVEFLVGMPWPEDALQLIGGWPSGRHPARVKEAPGLAAKCVAASRARGWEGDGELADSLEARLGTGPTPLLRPLAVDLEELAMLPEGDPVECGGRID